MLRSSPSQGPGSPAQPRGQCDAALAAANDQAVRLAPVAQFGLLGGAQFLPGLAARSSWRSVPRHRRRLFFSSWPRSSRRVVKKVQQRLSRSRRYALPRPARVSNASQAPTAPASGLGSDTRVQPCGAACSSLAANMARTASRPSTVWMFPVKAMKSRQ